MTHLSSQRVCHSDPLELPADDAGVEDGGLPGGREHRGPQTRSGQAPGTRGLVRPPPRVQHDCMLTSCTTSGLSMLTFD